MCGIAGFYNFNGAPANPHVLLRMMDIQRHRGPDDQGMRMFSLSSGRSAGHRRCPMPEKSHDFSGGLGFNRLSILDLSEHGHQPMANADESVFLAFNGEIYNAFDYTAELEVAGFRFRSKTDTEVILYLYERYGFEGMLERLNGMFAIVIVDLNKGEINIARDHFGVKPFYWWKKGDTFLFASEVKSFLAHPAFRPELAAENLDEYFAYRFCAGENHLLKGVQQLRPGHWLRVTPDGLKVRRYWDIPDEPIKANLSEPEALEKLDHLLRKSVESQLLADVKVGCQLSGGIDSSLVSVFARSHFAANMDTFSVVFNDEAYSEDKWISRAANVAQADSHRFMFTPEFFLDNLDSATWHLDQPLNHPNSLGIYLLAEKAKSQVTVLLSGEGADELMGGYMRFYYARLQPRVSPWLPVLQFLPGLGSKLVHNFGTPGDGVTGFLFSSLFQRPSELVKVRPEVDFSQILERRREIFSEGRSDHLSNCLKFDMKTYMVDLLVRQDKMTMAHSMENRVPFLDRELVDFVCRLPTDYLVSSRLGFSDGRMRNTKILLKKLASRIFPDDFVYRRKSGFSLPLVQYFADERFAEMMEDRLLPGIVSRGVLRADVVRNWWQNLGTLGRGMDETLWISIAFELWAQKFLDEPASHGLAESSVVSGCQSAESVSRMQPAREVITRVQSGLSVSPSTPKIRPRPERALRVTFCWAEVSGYIAACWRALAERHPIELHITILEGLSAAPVPGRDLLLSSMPHTSLNVKSKQSPEVIARLVAETAPDIIVTSGWLYRPYVKALLEPGLRHAALVVGMDSPWEGRWKQKLARFPLRRYLSRTDAVMVAGERSREYALRLGVPGERIFTGLYGYDFTHFANAAKEIRSQSSMPRRFLFTGRYVKEKDLETLLAAYQLYRQTSRDPWMLSCCGMGPLAPLLAGREGVADHGFVQPADLVDMFARHGAFIMPSRFEPWGVAIGEAAASGMPLICSTACGAALDLLRPFYNGLSFSPGDVQELAHAMTWIEEHYDDLPLMGSRSQHLAEAFSAEVWADRWNDCFRYALENRRN